jgi:hypothetical protein
MLDGCLMDVLVVFHNPEQGLEKNQENHIEKPKKNSTYTHKKTCIIFFCFKTLQLT